MENVGNESFHSVHGSLMVCTCPFTIDDPLHLLAHTVRYSKESEINLNLKQSYTRYFISGTPVPSPRSPPCISRTKKRAVLCPVVGDFERIYAYGGHFSERPTSTAIKYTILARETPRQSQRRPPEHDFLNSSSGIVTHVLSSKSLFL